MKNVFSLLQEVRVRPGMLIGYDNQHREKQLRELESMLIGYGLALEIHEIAEPGREFVGQFAQYVSGRLGVGGALGPVAAILEATEDGDSAWERFWELVDDYERHLQHADAPTNG